MTSFDAAIPVVLRHEGGWVNNPNDPGAETNFGISTLIIKRIQAKRQLTDAQTEQLLGIPAGTLYQPGYLKPMSVDAAKAIYRSEFWLPAYEQLKDPIAATKIFDFAVNAGAGNAHTVAQRTAVALGRTIDIDGALGPASVAAINACGTPFIQAMADQMGIYYRAIVVRRPASAEFLPNWLHRAAWGTV